MTDYPSIRPADVREGDVVRARFDAAQWPATIEGVVHFSVRDVGDNRLYVGGYVVSGATDLRLVSRTDWRVGDRCVRRDGAGPVETVGCVFPFTTASGTVIDGAAGAGYRNVDIGEYVPVFDAPTPPEPPLRVGDFVRDLSGSEGQITAVTDYPGHSPYCVNGQWREGHNLTSIEPPDGWPVGVGAGSDTAWFLKPAGCLDYEDAYGNTQSWADLLTAGGVPALAVTR